MLTVSPTTASEIELLTSLTERCGDDDRLFLALPFWPGAYAALQRRSPTWEIYGLFRNSRVFEETEIARIEAANPSFAVILDYPLDGRDDLRFKATHPLTYEYVRKTFRELETRRVSAFGTLEIYTRPVNRPIAEC